jgi:hypothetical protein
MTVMTRKARLAVIFGAIAIAFGIGVTLVMTNSQSRAGIFRQEQAKKKIMKMT